MEISKEHPYEDACKILGIRPVANYKSYKLSDETMKTLNSVSNDCPTQDNIINCSECDLECKLRMTTNNKEEVPPEPLPAVIYF